MRDPIEPREDYAYSYVHASSNGLILYGTPSIALARSVLGPSYKFYTFSNEIETEGFFIVIPRPIDNNTTENVKIPKIYKKYSLRSIEHLTAEEIFASTLHNEGVALRSVNLVIFKVYDHDTYRNYYLQIPELVHKMTHAFDREEYCNRLQQWIDLGWHPNIVRAYMIKEVMEDQFGLITDSFHTATLRDWINEGKGHLYEDFPFSSTRKLLNILLQIALGLTHMHDKMTVHHDLKPENIYIHEAETAKIGGLFLFSPRRFQVMKNKSPFVGGSPEYWSTEQGAIFDTMRDSIKDPRTYSGFINTLPHITEKSDIYSFGLIIMEILDGKRKWVRGDRLETWFEGWVENSFSNPVPFPKVQSVFMKSRKHSHEFRSDERPNAYEIAHVILDLYLKRFESPAERLWQRYFEPVENDCDSLNNMAVSYFRREKYEECLKFWDKAVSLDHNHAPSIYNAGLTRSLRNESNAHLTIRHLYCCPETPERNYFLTLLYINEGRFRVIFYPLVHNTSMLQEDAMKTRLEDFQSRYHSMVKREYSERFRFFQMTPAKLIAFAGQTRLFAYITMQNVPVLSIWNVEDFNECKIAVLTLEIPENRAVYPYNLAIGSTQKVFAFCMEINIYVYSYFPQQNAIKFESTLKGHQSRIQTMSFDNSNKRLASGGTDNIVRLWDCLEGTCFRLFRGHEAPVTYLCFTADDEFIASASEDCKMIIWDIYTGEEMHRLNSSAGPVRCLALDIDLKILICACYNQTLLHIWDLTLNKITLRLDGHWQICRGIEISHQRKLILSFSGDGMIRIWSLKTGNCLVTLGPYAGILTAKFSGKDDEIIFADEDLRIRTISFVANAELNGNELSALVKPCEIITNVEHYFSNEFIYKDSLDELARNFRKLMHQSTSTLIDNVFKIAEKVKTTTNLYRREEIRKIFYELNTLKSQFQGLNTVNYYMEAYTFPKPYHDRSNISCFVLNKSRTLLAIGETDGKIKVFKIATHMLLKTLKTNRSTNVISLDFSSDDTLLIESNSAENAIRIWSLEAASVQYEHNIHGAYALNVGIIHGNRTMVSCGQDSQIVLFDTKLREASRKRMSINKTESYTAMAVSEDNKALFTGSSDHIIRMWDINSKCRVKSLHGHSDIIIALHIDKETNTLISISLDNTIRFWSLITYRCDKIMQLPHYHVRYLDIMQLDRLAILTFHNSIVVIVELKELEVKWTLMSMEEVLAAVWYRYPSKILLITTIYTKIIDIFWKYA